MRWEHVQAAPKHQAQAEARLFTWFPPLREGVRKAAAAAEDKGAQRLEKDAMKNSPPVLELGELGLFQNTS